MVYTLNAGYLQSIKLFISTYIMLLKGSILFQELESRCNGHIPHLSSLTQQEREALWLLDDRNRQISDFLHFLHQAFIFKLLEAVELHYKQGNIDSDFSLSPYQQLCIRRKCKSTNTVISSKAEQVVKLLEFRSSTPDPSLWHSEPVKLTKSSSLFPETENVSVMKISSTPQSTKDMAHEICESYLPNESAKNSQSKSDNMFPKPDGMTKEESNSEPKQSAKLTYRDSSSSIGIALESPKPTPKTRKPSEFVAIAQVRPSPYKVSFNFFKVLRRS